MNCQEAELQLCLSERSHFLFTMTIRSPFKSICDCADKVGGQDRLTLQFKVNQVIFMKNARISVEFGCSYSLVSGFIVVDDCSYSVLHGNIQTA